MLMGTQRSALKKLTTLVESKYLQVIGNLGVCNLRYIPLGGTVVTSLDREK